MGYLPRVVVDARMVGGVGHGIAHYVIDLAYGLARLREQRKLGYDVIFLVDEKRNRQALLANFPTFAVHAPFLDPRENLEIPEVLTRLRADLFHTPSFSSPYFCPCPAIQTIHDLNHLHYGSLFHGIYYRLFLKRFARAARLVLTVSQFSRFEIAEWLDREEDSIEVVENAIRPELLDSAAKGSEGLLHEHRLQKGQYHFCLASLKKHKNLRTLLAAYAAFRKNVGAEKAWPLVLSLSPEKVRAPGVIALGPLDTANAMMLLKHSGALYIPSEYEGFGRTPLEALAMGVPIVASRIAPHIEGLAALPQQGVRFVDPQNTPAWSEALAASQLAGNERPGQATRAAILERYSVFKLAETMDQVYLKSIRRF